LSKYLITVLFIFLSVSCQIQAQNNILYMTSLEWPPYSGKKLHNQGITVAASKAIFKAMDYELVVDFYPWSRAIKLGLSEKTKYIGYFPEYYSSAISKTCNFSQPVGSSQLGFAQLKANPISWKTLDDIAKLNRVGIVQGYVNSAEFDKRVVSGNIKTDVAISDLINLKKLAAGRFPLMVIDKYVLEYLLENKPELSQFKNKIEFNEKLLEEKYLYLCFNNSENAETIKKIFDKEAHKLDMKTFFNGANH